MSLTIDKNTLDLAKSLLEQNKISEAWQALGDGGGNYARNAAQITGDSELLGKTLVQETWENTVGTNVYNQKFDSVAKRHLKNYLNTIEDINGDKFLFKNSYFLEPK